MAIHPDPRFPLLPRDQAEVIQLFLDLMREQDQSGRDPETAVHKPIARRHGSTRLWHAEDLPEID